MCQKLSNRVDFLYPADGIVLFSHRQVKEGYIPGDLSDAFHDELMPVQTEVLTNQVFTGLWLLCFSLFLGDLFHIGHDLTDKGGIGQLLRVYDLAVHNAVLFQSGPDLSGVNISPLVLFLHLILLPYLGKLLLGHINEVSKVQVLQLMVNQFLERVVFAAFQQGVAHIAVEAIVQEIDIDLNGYLFIGDGGEAKPGADGFSPMEVNGTVFTEKKEAGTAILEACKAMTSPDPVIIGHYRGFEMELFFESFSKEYRLSLKGAITHTASLGTDVFGNIVRIDNTLSGLDSFLKDAEAQLENVKVQLENAKIEVEKPFPQEEELNQKLARLNELNIKLNMDKRENEIADTEVDTEAPDREAVSKER